MRRARGGGLSSYAGLLLLLQLLLLPRGVNSGTKPCPQHCNCRHDSSDPDRPRYMVTCRLKNLTTVPDMRALLSVPDRPKTVTLALNRIERIDRNDFRPHLGITSLSLESNRRLVGFPDGLSHLGSSLLTLNLDSTGLYFSSPLTFLRGLSRLLELTLRNNNIRDFVSGSGHVTAPLFRDLGLTSLRVLDLSGCLLTDLDPVALEGLNALEVLHLDNNHFRHVPKEALRKLSNLKELTLSGNRLGGLGREQFPGLWRLERLVLRDNHISHVAPTALLSLEASLRLLDLHNCRLRAVPTSALAPLRALRDLVLTDNPLGADLGGLDLAGAYCLRRLELSGTLIDFAADTFASQADCLQELHLQAMGLMAPPLQALAPLQRLETLRLDYNHIRELGSGSLRNLTARTLVFTGCPLAHVRPGAFRGLRAPLSLGLERTALTSLEFFFEYPPGTFACMNVTDSQVECDCYLATIRDSVRPGGLHGDCLYKGGKVNVRSAKLDAILKDCKTAISLRNVNTESPPLYAGDEGGGEEEDRVKSSACHLEHFLVLFSCIVGLLLVPS